MSKLPWQRCSPSLTANGKLYKLHTRCGLGSFVGQLWCTFLYHCILGLLASHGCVKYLGGFHASPYLAPRAVHLQKLSSAQICSILSSGAPCCQHASYGGQTLPLLKIFVIVSMFSCICSLTVIAKWYKLLVLVLSLEREEVEKAGKETICVT
jgi:hypothetical protein